MKKSFCLALSAAMLFGCVCAGPAAIVGTAKETRYAATYGGTIEEGVTETVYYARKEISEEYQNPYKLPLYYAENISNSCVITSGGAIIGNFDLTYEELIPNHDAVVFLGKRSYRTQDDAVNAMYDELYERMGTTSVGTTIPGFKSGMTSYVQSKGRNIEITKVYSNSSLNASAYKSALQAGKLLTVFLNGLSIVYAEDLKTYDGYDTIGNTMVKGAHTVAVYGYRNIKYYNASDNLIQEDKYLLANTGFASGGLGMVRLNKYTTVDDGYAVNIT